MKRLALFLTALLASTGCGDDAAYRTNDADNPHVIDRRAEFPVDNLAPDENSPESSPNPIDNEGSELGAVEQPITVVHMWHGHQTNVSSRPSFLDIGNGAQYNLLGHCGSQGNAGLGCLLQKGPDEKTQWTWRWDKIGCGRLDIGLADVYSGTQFLASVRDAMTAINNASLGIRMVEVTSGEDITLFCDANAVSVIDPDPNITGGWFPFGGTADTQRTLLGANDRNCQNTSIGTIFRRQPVWTYSKAGISINADVLGNPRNAQSWVNPSVCSAATPVTGGVAFAGNVFFNFVLHEMIHHLGFHHFDADALMKTRASCSDWGNRNIIDSRMKSAIKGLRTRRCTNPAGYICSAGVGGCPDDCRTIFEPDSDLECIDPGNPDSSSAGVP